MTDPAPTAPKGAFSRPNLVLYGLLLAGVLAAFVAWRRAQNPLRIWAKSVEASHIKEIDTAMMRCFGTTDTAGVRRLAEAVRRGPLPTPFKDCFRGPMAELLVSPNAFVSSMAGTPIEVYNVRERERVALQRLMGSFRLLEHAVTEARDNPTEAQRAILASKLEEAAPDIDLERKTFEDLLAVARDQAGFF